MKKVFLFITLYFPLFVQSQLYFPPTSGSTWDTMAPDSLGWCQERIDSLTQFLEDRDTRSFVILKNGKIVLEEYFNGGSASTPWYWASCGKSLAAYLVGIAVEEGALDLTDPVSNYLGQGWTSCSTLREDSITISHLLTMTSGLDDLAFGNTCSDDTCLQYLAPAGTRWAYHTGAYRLLQDAVDSAYNNLNFSQFTSQKLGNKIGMGGFWLNKVRWGTARDMARFGLLTLNQGVWDGDTVLGNATYLYDMVHTANPYNEAYGYLWWLNGTNSYQLPSLQFVFSGPLVPSAPTDMLMALGKNDQKIYVIPSTNMVVIRQGEDASSGSLALSAFDDDLWQYINQLNCPLGVGETAVAKVKMYPNPATEWLEIEYQGQGGDLEWWDALSGRLVQTSYVQPGKVRMDVSGLPRGAYFIKVGGSMEGQVTKVILH